MKTRSLGLAAAALILLASASPTAAQTTSSLAVKDATGATRNLCETADGSGFLSSCTPVGAATSGLQATSNGTLASILTALGTPLQAGGAVTVAGVATAAGVAAVVANTKPVTTFGAVTVGTAFTPGLGIVANCTVAGNVVLAGSDGSTITVPVGVGFNQFGFAVASVPSETATCTFTALR